VRALYELRTKDSARQLELTQSTAAGTTNAFLDAALRHRRETILASARARLCALGALAPYLLVNVASQTTDALLYFHTAQTMVIVGHGDILLSAPCQRSLLSFLEAIGIDGRVLHEMGSLPIALSQTSGEFLIRTHEYQQWLEHGRPVHTPEPLGTCFQHLVLSRTDLGSALGALVDLAAAVADGSNTSAGAALVFRCFCLLDAISRRFAKHPLSARETMGGLERILSLSSPALREARQNLQREDEKRDSGRYDAVAPTSEWKALYAKLAEPLDRHAAAFLAHGAASRAFAARRLDFVELSRAEMCARLLRCSALLLTLIGFVPEWLAATGICASVITLLCHPAFEERTNLEAAARILLLLTDLGLDVKLLRELAKSSGIYATSASAAFVRARTNLAERVREAVWKTHNTDETMAELLKHAQTAELKAKLRLLLQSLPSKTERRREDDESADVEPMASLLEVTDALTLRALGIVPVLEAVLALDASGAKRSPREASRRKSSTSARVPSGSQGKAPSSPESAAPRSKSPGTGRARSMSEAPSSPESAAPRSKSPGTGRARSMSEAPSSPESAAPRSKARAQAARDQ
jgi:hypothetical protein